MPLYFNGGTQPLVPEGKWGEGVIMPGEPYETDAELGPPWTVDPEAAAALERLREVTADNPPESPAEPVSGPQDVPQSTIQGIPPTHMLAGAQVAADIVAEHASDGPAVRVEPNGDVVTEAGDVVGHIEPPPSGATTTGGTA